MRMTRTMLMVLATGLPCAALTVELRPEAETASSYIRLSDVASLPDASDDERARLEGLFLGRAPKEGGEATLTREEILGELRKQGIAAANVKFIGAEKTVITRGVAREASPSRLFSSKLARAVTRFLRRQPLFAGADVEVQVVGEFDVPKGEGSITEVTPDQTPSTGTAYYEATWKPEGGGAEKQVEFQARVTAFLQAAVAKRTLGANATITPDDVEITRVPIDAGHEYYTTLADVLGQKLDHGVAKGAPIDPSCLRAVVLVKNRDTVLVTVHGTGYGIEFYAEAQQDGAIGDAIRVKNLTTARVFAARVIGRGRVEPVGVGEGGNR